MNNSSNAKKLHEILLAEHRELLLRISELREWWFQRDELGEPNCEEMCSRLRQLRDLLATHFHQEEKDGYLQDALAVAPRFAKEAEELRLQHSEFLESLKVFDNRLAPCSSERFSWKQVRDDFEMFVDQLKKHESLETKILQSAFADDLGTGD